MGSEQRPEFSSGNQKITRHRSSRVLAVGLVAILTIFGLLVPAQAVDARTLSRAELALVEAQLSEVTGRLGHAQFHVDAKREWRGIVQLVVLQAEAPAVRRNAVELRDEIDGKVAHLRRRRNRLRRQARALEAQVEEARQSLGSAGPSPEQWAQLRDCESSGNYAAVSPSGSYRGAYQFDRATWQTVGGQGDPAAAPPAEQDARALALYESRGNGPWPHCGRYLP